MTTPDIILIIAILCLSFSIESIFGIGGTIIALTILGFFYDIREMVPLALFAGTIASLTIYCTDRKSFSSKILGRVLLFGIPGLFIGTIFLKYIQAEHIRQIFAIFLIIYSVWTLSSPHFRFSNPVKHLLNFSGGILGGMFGTPGPFLVAASREFFSHKSELRVTFAVIFLCLNLIRGPIYFAQGITNIEAILPFWWGVFPLVLCMYMGHYLHIKISEVNFQKGLSILLGLSGITFLF